MRPLLFILLFTSVAISDMVVTTGDSITVGYAPLIPSSSTISEGSLNAERYVGALDSSIRDFAQEVVDLDPEVIVFMLGANDSFKESSADLRFTLFTTHIGATFNEFAATNATTIVMSVLPIYYPNVLDAFGDEGQEGMNDRIANNYNPWLRDQVDARPNFHYLDVNAAIQEEPNWETTLLSGDGLHPSAAGNQWLASQVNTAITSVPEPSQWSLFAVIGGGVAAMKWYRRLRT